MFDIGFFEILCVAVVALLLVGPDEFPGLVRGIGKGLGKLRGFVSSVKSDLDFELEKAEKLKELVEKEKEIAELHRMLEAREAEQNAAAPAKKVVEEENGAK